MNAKLLAIDLKNGNSHFRKSHTDICKHGNSIFGNDLHKSLILLILLSAGNLSPFNIYKSVLVLCPKKLTNNWNTYKDNYVDAKGHTEVIDKAVAPTCTETGLTEGKHCDVCGEVLVAQVVVPVIDHTYTDKYDTDCNVCGAEREATTVVATIGETKFATLDDALAAAVEGDTIVVLTRIVVEGDVTWDLTGKTPVSYPRLRSFYSTIILTWSAGSSPRPTVSFERSP